MPTISVIVPVYKVEKYIHRCVDSILGQTYEDFELILVDDGSPDNCGPICDEYAAKDSRIVVIHQENGGLSAARNAGLDWIFAHSDSQWLTFIDSDDWVHQSFLSVLMDGVMRFNVNVSICGVQRVASMATSEIEWKDTHCSDTEVLYSQNEFSMIACAKLYNRKAFEEIRFPVGKLHEDIYTTYKLLFLYPTVAVSDCPLYYYWQNPDSITHKRWSKKRLDEILAIEEQLLYFQQRNLVVAEKRAIKAYLYILAKQIKETQSDSAFYYSKRLKEKLRRAIVQYKRVLPIRVSKNAYELEIAYPFAMACYWYGKKIIRRIWRGKE